MKLEGKTCLILYNAANGKPPEETAASDFDIPLNERVDVRAIRQALKENQLNVRTLGLRRINSKTTALLEEINPDLVFNLCEMLYNHPHKSLSEIYVAGWLDLMKLPYTGSHTVSLFLSLNKARCKQILRQANIPVPPSITVAVGEKPNLESITPPFIIKPVREDGSFGITKNSVVKKLQEVEEKVLFIHEKYNQPALVEEFIDGREFRITMIDNPPSVLGIGEIDFSDVKTGEPKIFSYDAKWRWDKNGSNIEAKYPAEIETSLKNRLEKIAVKSFRLLGCRDYASIDMRVSENRRPYVLEVNPNPDISMDGDFGDSCKASGITYSGLIKNMVENTLTRGTNIV